MRWEVEKEVVPNIFIRKKIASVSAFSENKAIWVDDNIFAIDGVEYTVKFP